MNAENPRTSSICVIQPCDVWSISSACPHLKYIFIEWRILHMTRYKLQIQESCPLKLAAKRCPLQRRQWQRCSGQYNSSVQYSVAQMAPPETGSPMQESPSAPLALLHHFCFHLIYHSALCYKLHYFRRFSCPELTDLLMFKQKSRAGTEQFL